MPAGNLLAESMHMLTEPNTSGISKLFQQLSDLGIINGTGALWNTVDPRVRNNSHSGLNKLYGIVFNSAQSHIKLIHASL